MGEISVKKLTTGKGTVTINPMTSHWQTIIGHDWAVEAFQAAIQHRRMGHAYLITGPEQVGKTSLARLFVQALNCREAQAPCGQCRSCRLIATDRHPDVRLVLPEISGRGNFNLKIDQIRALQHELNLGSYESAYKIAILKRFDTANVNAANAFLKTLEEPPAGVILLLTATDADGVLPTIASRCRTIPLRPVPAGPIAHLLQHRHQLPADQATLLAHLADGRPGWAIQASQNPALLRERQQILETLQEALQGNHLIRFALADKLTKKAEELPFFLKNWLGWWRDVALLAFGQGEAIVNIDQKDSLQILAGKWAKESILQALRQTEKAIWQLERNANSRLVMEVLFLTYPAG